MTVVLMLIVLAGILAFVVMIAASSVAAAITLGIVLIAVAMFFVLNTRGWPR
jgi:hypothetical protein